ncbi:MAG: hypothetical protein Q4B63_00990 [Clostridium perfringens]|nr:hypothetical protein [Clostridium perfringens]
MSFLGKGVNKFFTSLGSLLKKLVELIFDLLGFIKFKISKKSYNAREESSRKGKIAGRKVKNNMDKFAIKAQVGTDKGLIFLGKFLRLLTFGALKLFNSISRGLYNASEKSKDKFTSYNVSQDEKNKEKFIEFDNLIAKCDDIENYEEAAISNYGNEKSTNLENTIFDNINSYEKSNYNNDKNMQNKINKGDIHNVANIVNTYDNNEDDDIKEYTTEEKTIPHLDHTLYGDINSYSLNKENDSDLKEFVLNKQTTNDSKNNTLYNNDFDLDKTLLEDSSFSDSVKLSSKLSDKNTIYNKDIDKDINIFNKGDNTFKNNDFISSKDVEEVPHYEHGDMDDYEDDAIEDESPRKIFNFLKKKDKDSSFDETFHGEDYEFNSSIKLANENYSKNKNIESSSNKLEFTNLNSKKEDDSDKTQMINKNDFRESLNSRLQSQYNNRARTYKSSLDDDDESIRKFLSDDE